MGFIRGGVKRRKTQSADPEDRASTPKYGRSAISNRKRPEGLSSAVHRCDSEGNFVNSKQIQFSSREYYPVGMSLLERLPAEIIQAIFIESQNFDLPQVSQSIYSQICGTQYLHKLMLEKHIKRHNKYSILPIGLLKRNFITRGLLDGLGSDVVIVADGVYQKLPPAETNELKFDKIAIPEHLEHGPFTVTKIQLIKFLIPRFCFFQNPGKIFLNAVDDNQGSPNITNSLLELDVKPDWRSLLWAIKKHNYVMARKLVETKLLDPSDDGLWIYVVKMRDMEVMKQLQQLGGSPSIEAIKFMNRHYDNPGNFTVKDLVDLKDISGC